MRKDKYTITEKQITEYRSLESLLSALKDATLESAEAAHYADMIQKKKRALVADIYFKDKKRKEFYYCKDGRVKSYNPQFIAKSEDELIEKLYEFYFSNTLQNVYEEWLNYRNTTQTVSAKTIEEDMGLWRRFLAKTDLADMQIAKIKPKHIMKLFQSWTGNGLITRKDFNNRKSLLNGIFKYAVLNEFIPYNPISSIPCNDLKFKMPAAKKKAYTIEERNALLAYLETLEPDAYILAIILAFHGIFRIGEIKALEWDEKDENQVLIRHQLIEQRVLKDDMTLSHPHRILKDPKGNPCYSIRTEYLSSKGLAILRKMKALNPNGEFLFMYEGRPLTTATFNRRLKKYCKEVGIPYLSSHKIRFTGASMLYNSGVKAIDIQPLLGHSTLSMTEHYIGQRVTDRDTSQMAHILK